MAKDFTDYVVMVLDSGDRVYHLTHLRNDKECKIDGRPYPANGHNYLLNLDRAYRIKWAPWKKMDRNPPYGMRIMGRMWMKPWWPLWAVNELLRSKKIGLLIYQEPNPPVIVEDKVPIRWLCSGCDFETESPSGIKIHIKAKHTDEKGNINTIEPPEVINKITKRTVGAPEPIAPMHISRIHQPSGVMKG